MSANEFKLNPDEKPFDPPDAKSRRRRVRAMPRR